MAHLLLFPSLLYLFFMLEAIMKLLAIIILLAPLAYISANANKMYFYEARCKGAHQGKEFTVSLYGDFLEIMDNVNPKYYEITYGIMNIDNLDMDRAAIIIDTAKYSVDSKKIIANCNNTRWKLQIDRPGQSNKNLPGKLTILDNFMERVFKVKCNTR